MKGQSQTIIGYDNMNAGNSKITNYKYTNEMKLEKVKRAYRLSSLYAQVVVNAGSKLP